MNKDRQMSPQVPNNNGLLSNTSSNSSNINFNSASISSSTGGLKTASLSEIWDDLKNGIESVYSQQTMSKARYMSLYSLVKSKLKILVSIE